MTATTTIQESRPTSSHRPVWAQLAFALAGAAIGSLATVAVTDADDGPAATARTEAAPLDADLSTSSAVPASADAAERWATANEADRVGACTSSATSADAAERCLGREASGTG